MAQANTCQQYTYPTQDQLWGETFYTDRPISTASDLSMPGMVPDCSDSEASGDDNYHLSTTRLFDSYHHDPPPRAVSTLLTQVNRTYARESHHYPSWNPPSRQSNRRRANVLQSLESKLNDPKPSRRVYGTWPLSNDASHLASSRPRPPVPRRPSVKRCFTTPLPQPPPVFSLFPSPILKENNNGDASPEVKDVNEVNEAGDVSYMERSYWEDSDDDESDDEEAHNGIFAIKAMKRLHIRSPSSGKIGADLRKLFRTSKKA